MSTIHPGGILCLDLATVVGWAYGHVGDAAPAFGTWHLPRIGGEGARYVAFENELAATLDHSQPSHVVLEAPLPLPAQTDMATCRQQLGLRAIAYAEAWRASAAISEIDALSVRLTILGRLGFRKGEIKGEVLRYVRGRGWNVPDHNAADACMIWLWHVHQVRGIRPAPGPLFRERA